MSGVASEIGQVRPWPRTHPIRGRTCLGWPLNSQWAVRRHVEGTMGGPGKGFALDAQSPWMMMMQGKIEIKLLFLCFFISSEMKNSFTSPPRKRCTSPACTYPHWRRWQSSIVDKMEKMQTQEMQKTCTSCSTWITAASKSCIQKHFSHSQPLWPRDCWEAGIGMQGSVTSFPDWRKAANLKVLQQVLAGDWFSGIIWFQGPGWFWTELLMSQLQLPAFPSSCQQLSGAEIRGTGLIRRALSLSPGTPNNRVFCWKAKS